MAGGGVKVNIVVISQEFQTVMPDAVIYGNATRCLNVYGVMGPVGDVR